MAAKDEFRDKIEALKDQPLKERLKYYRDYYLAPTLIGLAVIIGAVWLVKDMITAKDSAFNGVFVNALQFQEDISDFTDPFAETAGIDLEEYDIRIDSNYTLSNSDSYDENSYYSMQIIMTRMAAQEIDVLAMDTANFSKYVYNESFMDLREVLPEDLLDRLAAEGKLYYMDQTFLPTLKELQENVYEDTSTVIEYPQYSDPTAIEDPIPVGIRLDDCELFKEYFAYGETEAYIGIVINALNMDNAKVFIDYLYGE